MKLESLRVSFPDEKEGFRLCRQGRVGCCRGTPPVVGALSADT